MTSTALASVDDTAVAPLAARISETAYAPPVNLPFEAWESDGYALGRMEKSIQWWIGDWLNFGERAYGEKYAQAMETTGLTYEAVAHYAWVANKVCTRVQTLSWAHHREVAALSAAEQEEWLDVADREGLSTRELKKRLRARSAVTPSLPTGQFSAIVIDPPWPIEKIEREVRPNQGPALDYPTMPLEQIETVCGEVLAGQPQCHVYLWVTQKYLPAGLKLFEAWDVKYQCVMTWVKNVGPTPFSWMYDTEHVLFGRRGSLPLNQMGLRLSFQAAATGHSVKPAVFYERVCAASPEPRLAMFERGDRPGFEVWGDELAA